MNAKLGGSGRCGVGVVPVRETEAWAMADTESLREVLGTTLSGEQLGLPRTGPEIEALLDPKATFASVVRAARPGRHSRRRPAPVSFLDLLGQQTRISELKRLGAFCTFQGELRAALHGLGFV